MFGDLFSGSSSTPGLVHYTYLLGDPADPEGGIIDTVFESSDRIWSTS